MNPLREFVEGWKVTCKLARRILAKLLALLKRLLERLRGRTRGERDYRDTSCLYPPPKIRARPDPYIYSQEWLAKRGLAFVWDNPDFRILDVATGAPVDRLALKANTDYDVEARIHNNSFMAAINTKVHFEVRGFGVGTPLLTNLGTVVLDIPGAGFANAVARWRTPPTGGHNCLRAIIHHVDDANPLNNVGQHNTDVAVPASPARRIAFTVGNDTELTRHVRLVMNAYRLPDEALCARGFQERQSVGHLRRLQTANDPQKFPVPVELRAKLSAAELRVKPGQAVNVTLEFTPPAGPDLRSVNVNAYDGNVLLGGITAYARGDS